MSVESRGVHKGGGRASRPCGRLVAFLTCTPSPLDVFWSKKNHRESFIPFGIPFLRNSKTRKKTEIDTGLYVNRLVPKII